MQHDIGHGNLGDKEQEVIDKIESLVQRIIQSFADTNDCSILTPNGTVRFGATQSTITFARLMSVLNTAHYLLNEKKHMRKRDLYYSDVTLFMDAENSSNALDSLSAVLQVPRNRLNIFAADRGIVIGNLKFEDNGGLVDCMQYGTAGKAIPAHVDNIKDITSDAKFILVVEKESSLLRLSDDRFYEKHGPCIILTAKGNPDLGTRLFTKRLHQELGVPVFYLGDWDPFGVQILLTYCVGSKKGLRQFEQNLFLPEMIWIGPHYEDLSNLPESCFLKLTPEDTKKANALLAHPTILEKPLWQYQLTQMLAQNKKAEIQALSSISISYLSDVFLPRKLASAIGSRK